LGRRQDEAGKHHNEQITGLTALSFHVHTVFAARVDRKPRNAPEV
jgi:hypothetical protein